MFLCRVFVKIAAQSLIHPLLSFRSCIFQWDLSRVRIISDCKRYHLSRFRCPGEGAAREVPDGEVRQPPDGADPQAAGRRDVALRRAAEALWDAGQSLLYSVHNSVLHNSDMKLKGVIMFLIWNTCEKAPDTQL